MATAKSSSSFLNARLSRPSSSNSRSSSPKLVQLPPAPSVAALGAVAVAAWIFPAPPIAVAAELISLQEPANALSLPTWAVHVSSVAEWVTAMALVWKYGDKPGLESWKGLSWGMVPLLGGAFCACTWHFFYNAESLEILVALQAALTIIGNFTMCIAAYRIYKKARPISEKP